MKRETRKLVRNKTCVECKKRYLYMSRHDFQDKNDDISMLDEDRISHSRDMYKDCHNEWIKHEIWLQVKKDFSKLPNYQKSMMFACGQLPSDICYVCGERVEIDKSHYESNTGTTWWNRCEKCSNEEMKTA